MSLRTRIWLLWHKLRRSIAGRIDPHAPAEEKTYQDMVWENALAAHEEESHDLEHAEDEAFAMTPYMQARSDATLAELMTYAERRKARRARVRRERRSRRLAIATATAGFAVVGVGGASALTGVSTGIPELDRVLGTYDAHPDRPETPPGMDLGGTRPSRYDMQWKSGTTTVSLGVPSLDPANAMGIITAFTSRADWVCSTSGDAERVPRPGPQPFTLGCMPADFVIESLDRVPALMAGVTGRPFVVHGFTSEDVVSISGRGPYGPLELALSEPWDPGIPGLKPVRLFVAAVTHAEGRGPEDTTTTIDPASYTFFLRMADGSVVDVHPWRHALDG